VVSSGGNQGSGGTNKISIINLPELMTWFGGWRRWTRCLILMMALLALFFILGMEFVRGRPLLFFENGNFCTVRAVQRFGATVAYRQATVRVSPSLLPSPQ
jgi:hypothetical protein